MLFTKKSNPLVIFKRYVAFTLAEILIVVSIVGIVAELTLPALIQNAQEKAIVSNTQKAFTVFSQAIKMSVIENGPIETWGCADNSCWFNKITPYLQVAKNCGLNTGQGCFPSVMYWRLDKTAGQGNWDTAATYPKARLTDGMSFFTQHINSNCLSIVTGNANNLALNNVCSYIFVDVNGNNQPNTCGNDFLMFWVTKYGVVPGGTPDDTANPLSSTCSNKSGIGYGCAAWIIYKQNQAYLNGAVTW